MKIAIVSDLHATHWLSRPAWDDYVAELRGSIAREKPDLVVDAGDSECDVAKLLDVPRTSVLSVKGNHDWYHKDFAPRRRFVLDQCDNTHKRETQAMIGDGFLAIGCTLWTDYRGGDPEVMYTVDRGMRDPQLIKNFNATEAYAEHRADVAWLDSYRRDRNAARVDLVVTHHAPSLRSIHPRYKTADKYVMNYGFASDLDHLVEAISPRVWVHGHVHDAWDYMIGDTRVIANPFGYPFERMGTPYEPVYVEL